MRFAGISLITKNVPNLAAFYSKVLGVEADGDDTHVELHTEGAGMTIISVEGMENLAPQSMQGAGTGCITIGFEVKNVDDEYDRLKSFGVEFKIKIHSYHHQILSQVYRFSIPLSNESSH